jgi:hypothetical protein
VRLLIVAVVLILLSVMVVHNLPAPFPSAQIVLDTPYESLLRELGPPADYDPNSKLPTRIRSIQSVAWIRPRLIAHWTLQVDYRLTPFGPQARPDGVSRCLETKWQWLNWLLPCEAAFRGRVAAH